MKSSGCVRAAGLVIGVAGLAGAAHASFVASAIFAGTGPRNVVPGTSGVNPGERFLPTGQFMDRIYRSQNGQHWILTARTNTGSTATDEIVITGSGTGATTRVREGSTILGGADAARTIDSGSIDERVSINDSGDFVFAANLSPAASPDDELIIRGGAAGGFSVAHREGRPESAPGLPAAFANGTSLTSANIDNSGRTSFRSAFITGTGVTSATNVVLLRQSGAILDARLGVTGPSNIPARQFDLLDIDGYFVDASGDNWLTFASLTGPTTNDGVMVYNGVAMMQEGVTFVAGGDAFFFVEWGLIPTRGWWASGNNGAGGSRWVVAGDSAGFSVVAQTDQPILTGSLETWDDAIFSNAFFQFAADNAGNYVLGGLTNNPDLARNAVLVYKGVLGEFEVIREGDAVDLDGNGLLDDDAFINIFNDYDGVLTDAHQFIFQATLRNAAGADIGQALLTITIPTPGGLALLGLAGVVAARRRR